MEDSEEERSDIEEEAVCEQLEEVGGGTVAGHGMEPRSRVFEELWEEEDVDELKEYEDEEEEEEDAGVKTEPETEVKTEYGVEVEPYDETGHYENEEVYETEPPREERSLYGPSAYQGYGGVYYTGPGYGSYGGYSQPLEYEGYGEAYEEPRYHRGASGFSTRYTGPETRRVGRPTFSWRPSAPRALRPPVPRMHGPLPGWRE
ncbi:hypothetical protein PR002_g26468 [Phytophthora rubi]|uniref:Uncharacterized protein n=1 Tax=Phytophthora rubi TaxID=129364 RepID=A0A6A3HQ02_9STRA|nr:hypothetical protein PR002_g26468 [Phytophthora rubi]